MSEESIMQMWQHAVNAECLYREEKLQALRNGEEATVGKGAIQQAAFILIDAALNELQADPHQWSERPCATCRTISSMLNRKFGCVLYADQRKKEPTP